jgi:hypothetical protein
MGQPPTENPVTSRLSPSFRILAFQKVAHLIPQDVPVILESRVDESEIQQEIQNAVTALSARDMVVLAGD